MKVRDEINEACVRPACRSCGGPGGAQDTFFKSLAILATYFPLPKYGRKEYQIIYTKLGQRYSLMYERSLADSAVRIPGRKRRS